MSDMIEAAAKAICATWGYCWDGDPDEDGQVAPETNVGFDERPSKELFREAARAVLTRLREPTPGMVAKGAEETHGEVSDEYGAELATDVFRAMIDAALDGKDK